MAASCPSNKLAAVTKRTWFVNWYFCICSTGFTTATIFHTPDDFPEKDVKQASILNP
jgi:hypothetical protein